MTMSVTVPAPTASRDPASDELRLLEAVESAPGGFLKLRLVEASAVRNTLGSMGHLVSREDSESYARLADIGYVQLDVARTVTPQGRWEVSRAALSDSGRVRLQVLRQAKN